MKKYCEMEVCACKEANGYSLTDCMYFNPDKKQVDDHLREHGQKGTL